MAKKFGLIGKTLKHSWSKLIHELLSDYSYELKELQLEEIEGFVSGASLDGFNITIPYKKDVMPYLDEIDQRALSIGAVNTVVYRNGKKLGFNTDFDGMVYLLNRAGITVKDKNNSNKNENEDIQSKENENSQQVFNEKYKDQDSEYSIDLNQDKLKEDLVKILDVSIETIEID